MGEEKRDGLPEEEFSALLDGVTRMAPLLKGFLPPAGGGGEREEKPHAGGCQRREALLVALKPYLSPERCAAVDYLIRLSRVGDAIRSLQ